jgi:hypothetical protein
MDLMELALEDLDSADQLLKNSSRFPNLDPFKDHFILRKSALLLTLGRTREAVAILQNYEPKQVETVLLYKFLEQNLHVPLLKVKKPELPMDRSDYVKMARALFLAVNFEKAEQLLKEKPYGQLLRADCLTLLNRTEEAREIRKKEAQDKEYLDEEYSPEYTMLLLLHGDLPAELPWNYTSWEQHYHFPLRPFVKAFA